MNNLNGMTLPTCEILVNGQKRKLYGKKKNKVYLHNGDNFQLKLFNPLQERIGAQLRMNGIKVDNDLLVLNPGQEITIERFIGTNRKLTFSTYEIDVSNKEAVKAIEKNGILEVVFWNEKIQTIYTATSISTVNVGTYPYYTTGTSGATITINGRDITINGPVNGNLRLDSRTSGSSGHKGVSGFSGAKGPIGKIGIPVTSDAASIYNNNISSTINFISSDFETDFYTLSRSVVQPSTKLETGRIEKGGVSNQYFSSIIFDVGEEFYKIKFKLLPFSLKPVKKNSMILQR